MQKYSQTETFEHKNSEHCVVTGFPAEDSDINFAIVKVSSRYPDKGLVTNTLCKEMAYVQEGGGKIVVDDIEYVMQKGDVVLIDRNEKYYWDGDMTLHIACTPAFTPEQHICIES